MAKSRPGNRSGQAWRREVHERCDHESEAGHLERQENNAEELGIEVKDELKPG
jgi:hypothetical protein